MPKHPLEVWMQPVAAAAVAGFLPLVAGALVRLFSPGAAPWVVLVSSPPVVFHFPRWAAATLPRFARVRATIVGLGPTAVLAAVAFRRRSEILSGDSPLDPTALLIWSALNLACGVLAGFVVARRERAAP